MRRPIDLPAPLWPPLAAFGALVFASPQAAGAVAAVAASATALLVIPASALMALVAVGVTGIPKAGATVDGFPVPVMLVLLLGALPLLRQAGTRARVSQVGVLAVVWLAVRMAVMILDGGEVGELLALAGWYGLPLILVMAGPALGSLRGEAGRRWVRYLEFGILGACAFGIVQWIFGVTRFSIPGVTLALGADYSAKPLLFEGGSKIPSTYQNGNVLGVATGFFFLVAADRLLAGGGTRRNWLLLGATAAATMLSGSRTVVLGMALGLVVLAVRSRANHRTIGVGLAVGISILAVLAFSPSLSDRLLGTTPQDPNVVLRTNSWSEVLSSASLVELATGDDTWVADSPVPGRAEGLVGAVQQVGILGVALFLATFVLATNRPDMRRWRILLIPVAVSLAVDSAYLVFPTLFIPLARMFAPLAVDDEVETSSAEDAGLRATQTS